MKRYDTIILGVTNASLVTANILLKKNKNVLIVSKDLEINQYTKSSKLGRFEFDNNFYNLFNYGDSNNFYNLKNLFDQLDINISKSIEAITGDFKIFNKEDNSLYTFPRNIKDFVFKMEEYVPGSKNSVDKFISLIRECKGAINYLISVNFKADYNYLKSNFSNFMKVSTYNLKDVLYAIKMPKKAENLLSALWIYLGESITRINFVDFAILWIFLMSKDLKTCKYNTNFITMSLFDKYKKMGGNINFGLGVKKLIINNNRVEGVMLYDDEIYYANNIVSAIAPQIVFKNMLDDYVPSNNSIKYINFNKPISNNFTIHLGLNRSSNELNIKENSYFIYDNLDSDIEFKNNDSLFVKVDNNTVKGTTKLTFNKLFFQNSFMDLVKDKDYYKFKEEYSNLLIDKFEMATGLNIKDFIEEIEILTPIDYMNQGIYNGSLIGYTLYNNDFLSRMISDNDELINGLSFVGMYSSYGNKLSFDYLSGEMVANNILVGSGNE